jgi:hypothetical protein
MGEIAMIARLQMVLAIAALLLAMAHMALLPLLYPAWSIDALWFAGSGLAMLAVAAANFLTFDPVHRSNHLIMVAVNLMMACYFVAAWLVLPEIQVVIGGLSFAGLALFHGWSMVRMRV